jgi:NAD(P)-dependent dehydrogenase (short-subunit alcohol dehydrogenase family)
MTHSTPPPLGKDHAAVILGAYGGIGSALARRLARRGVSLLVAGRDAGRLAALAGEIGCESHAVDAARPDQVRACMERAVDLFGQIDGIACCAGSVLLKPAHLTSDDDWNDTVAANLTPAFLTVREATRVMTRSGGGSIVLVSSAAARTGLPNHEAIAAAKGGIIGLTLSAAATYGGRGIRVNCVAPGLVRTPLTQRITSSESALKASQAMHALGRVGEADEVAGAIEWLLDPANSWITGQVLGVDGGLGTVRAAGEGKQGQR